MKVKSVTVTGDSGTDYSITAHPGGVLYCTCPAWKNQKQPQAKRTCKHIKFVAQSLRG